MIENKLLEYKTMKTTQSLILKNNIPFVTFSDFFLLISIMIFINKISKHNPLVPRWK